MIYSRTQKQDIFRCFIKAYFEFLEYIHNHIGRDNKDFHNFYHKNKLLRKANVKIFIKKWYENISVPYGREIMNGNIDYFINKNYDYEVSLTGNLGNELSIQTYIDYMKNAYVDLDQKILDTIMNYMQQCTKMSVLYYNVKTN